MPSVNQCWGVMHGQLWNINCFHLTLLPVRSHVSVCVCVLVACMDRQIYLHHQHWLRLMCPSSGGGHQGSLLTGQCWLLIELYWWARGEVHYNTDTLIMCLHPLSPPPTPPCPPPTSHVIDLFFNAQTNGSLIIPGYFLGSLLRNPLKRNSNVKWAGERTLFAQ